MSRDIKVGDYIRTSHGHIGKIKRIEKDKNDENLKWYVYEEKEYDINIVKEIYITKPYIIDASPNIRDLVREGDYINGSRVYEVFNGLIFVEGNEYTTIAVKNIDSFLTKEAFDERAFYKIREN